MVNADLSIFVEEFANCVMAQDEAIALGNSTAGNEFARRYVAAFDTIRSYGNSGRDALACLLEDTRPSVKVMAAAFLLRHCGPKAIQILESEARGQGLVAFGAAQALRRWKEGTWSLDPA